MSGPKDWAPRPRSVEHETHAVFDAVRDLADRAVKGGTIRDIDRQLAAAEESLAELRAEFPVWMASELADIETVWLHYKSGADDGPKLLFRKVHDMRGQASTFGFPLAGKAADLLCKLMDALLKVPEDVIEAHIQTIRVIVRENINVDDHPVALMMISSLEKLGHDLIKKALASKTP